MTRFSDCFKAAAGNEPYPYQSEFATRNDLPALLSVPTGCGKTAAVTLGGCGGGGSRARGPGGSGDRASASFDYEANWLRLADLKTSCKTAIAHVEGLGYGR